MNQDTLHKEYIKIENRIANVVNVLERYKNTSKYKDLYKGISTLQSPLIYKPEILFLGTNSGNGAYKEANDSSESSENKTPLKWYNRPSVALPSEIDWFKKGNARIDRKTGEKQEWYQRDKKMNNAFPKNMIDLLYEVAKLKYPEDDHNYNTKYVPTWNDELAKNIMYTNLYPIATTDIDDLKKVEDLIENESELRALWKGVQGTETAINNWVVKKYFLTSILELIKLVQPKMVVCIGMSATNDFTFKKYANKNAVTTERTFDGRKIPIVGFTIKKGWHNNIAEIAKAIVG